MKQFEGSQQPYFQAGGNISGIHLVIVTQLIQLMAHMQSLDEVFSWLTDTFVQRFRLQAMQVWTRQAHNPGSAKPELRTTVYHSVSSSVPVLTTVPMTSVATYVLDRKQGFVFTPVEHGFAAEQANFMKHYGFNYIGGCYYGGQGALPPQGEESAPGGKEMPLTLAALLYGQEAQQQVLPLLKQVLERTMPIATNRGLLYVPPQGPPPLTKAFDISDLIPVYTQDDALKSDNPFSRTVVLENKEARRFYRQIDGRKTVAELLGPTRVMTREGALVLQILLDMRLIHLHTTKGEFIEPELVLDTLRKIR